MSAMKRPSEVPPVVDSAGDHPGDFLIAAASASTSLPRGVRKGFGADSQSSS
jgi:hypothetical protein